jgi:hypothetical protein
MLVAGFSAVVWAAEENIRVKLPAGWKEGDATAPASQFGKNDSRNEYFQLIVESKDDFSSKLDLMGYSKRARSASAKSSKLATRVETNLVPRKVAGKDTVEYEVTGEFKETRLHYRHIALACGKTSWCQIVAWTVPSHWTDAQTDFDGLVKILP